MTECRDCRYCIHRPSTDATGAKSSRATCGKVHLTCEYARKAFEDVVAHLPDLDPARWCGPEALLFEARIP